LKQLTEVGYLNLGKSWEEIPTNVTFLKSKESDGVDEVDLCHQFSPAPASWHFLQDIGADNLAHYAKFGT